jgi:hypothetical protein
LGVKQVVTALLLLIATSASAADFAGFVKAIHQVETSGRIGGILGDQGRSYGPLQVSRAAWQDSRVGGRYEDVADLAVATAVLRAYLTRYSPRALAAEDWTTCARVWNGGPRGASKAATVGYARAVVGRL